MLAKNEYLLNIERTSPMKRFAALPEYPESYLNYQDVSLIGKQLGITLSIPSLKEQYFIYFQVNPKTIVIKENKSRLAIPVDIPHSVEEINIKNIAFLNKERISMWATQWLLYKTQPQNCALIWN